MTSDSGFLTLVKISAFSRLGIHTGLRWFLQILLDTFFVYKSTAAAPRNFKKNCKKRYTFCFFKHIICVSEKSERTAPVGLAKAGIVVSGCLT